MTKIKTACPHCNWANEPNEILFWPNVKDKKMRVQFTCRNCKKESMISMEVDKIEYLEEVV
jgi:hypothetical protein